MNRIKKLKLWMIVLVIITLSILSGASLPISIGLGVAFIIASKLVLIILKRFVAKGMYKLGAAYISRISLALNVIFYIDSADFNKVQLKATEGLDEFTEKLSTFMLMAPKSSKEKLKLLSEQMVEIIDEISNCIAERDKLFEFEANAFMKNKELVRCKQELLEAKLAEVTGKIMIGEFIVNEDYLELVMKSISRYNRKLNNMRRG